MENTKEIFLFTIWLYKIEGNMEIKDLDKLWLISEKLYKKFSTVSFVLNYFFIDNYKTTINNNYYINRKAFLSSAILKNILNKKKNK